MIFKPSILLRFLGGLALAVLVLGFVVLRVTSCAPIPKPPAPPLPASTPGAAATPSPEPPPVPPQARFACGGGPADAARANAGSLKTLAWAPFGRSEAGWATYAPLIAREIRAACAPDTPGFAGALAAWAGGQGAPADGVMTPAIFARLKGVIQMRRPFVRLSAQGVCPNPPPASALSWASAAEGYGGKLVQLRPGALAAYRQMVAAARRESPQIAADPRSLMLFSGFRDPAADAARCAREGNCNGVQRATCSAHRTGLAVDVYVGQAPGFPPDSSAEANRLYMSRTAAYRWLVANADRFGFVPYPFEPWHWEWTGEAP
ncbi:D-alanyl-D-alanine carboxypeptidase family protein [Phenylobacterium sp.]|uniref:D-alanyl-D-alanine carboxypeptidase family protein n=1 Tax=Phenylobacterium sp. TaxID=1871053 RepID=UPI002E36C8CC|nr:D-alanyl-D-alanine carboxypeptidase family protein [Phenylobacterium sp.]HEX3366907.1 D-alanyl-D-alanine carboxypeptidase family protein [Phenylobacterium sp.]